MNRLIHNIAILGTTAVLVWGVKDIVRHERRHTKRTLKQQMQTWEGEGGNFSPPEQVQVLPIAGS